MALLLLSQRYYYYHNDLIEKPKKRHMVVIIEDSKFTSEIQNYLSTCLKENLDPYEQIWLCHVDSRPEYLSFMKKRGFAKINGNKRMIFK